jgi:predicted DNA-binding transcriptional regulator AlpA
VSEPDLIPISRATTEFGLSRSVIFKYLKQGRLKRWEKGGDRRTFVDRAEVRRLVQPRLKGKRA